MYLTKKEIENHKIQRNHTGNNVQKCYKTKMASLDSPGYMNCHLIKPGQMEKLAYTNGNDNFSASIRQPFGLTEPYYSSEYELQKHPEPIQRQPDKNIIQFTRIVPSEDGGRQTKSIFGSAPDVVLGDDRDGEQKALFTRAKLSNGHVMLILEWHDGHNTGNLVEHLIYTESDEKASIERKKLATEEDEDRVRENRLVQLDRDVFSLYRLATSTTASFEHKVLTLEQKERVIESLESENGKSYEYALGARSEEEPYDCVSWADKIWNKYQDALQQ